MSTLQSGLQPENLYCVIMAGGAGTRFWPVSRQPRPKQFLDILGTGRTLLQQTADRFLKIIPRENILVVTHKNYFALVSEQLPELQPEQILLEPSRRNTAPCIAYATARIRKENPNALMVVAPSDHLIGNEDAFLDQVQKGFRFSAAEAGIVTLGLMPSRPDTGYGYIQYHQTPHVDEVCKVKTFTEKPNEDLARSFVSSGDFLWNSGLFISSVKTMEEAFRTFQSEMFQVFLEMEQLFKTPEESSALELAYAQCTNISIDYAILEKAGNVYVIPSEFGWSDLGTWGSLYENSDKDSSGNAIVGKRVLLHDTQNCVVHMPKNKVVVIQGLDAYIVVESDGMLLICRKENEQEIRQMVSNVKVQFGEEFI